MPLAKITGQGLAAMTVSVGLLWCCVIGQRATERRAFAERDRVMREVNRNMRSQPPRPVSVPLRPHFRPPQPVAG